MTPSRQRAAEPRPTLASLPTEMVERIVEKIEHARDLAAANATSRLFRGPPGGSSLVEHALRERARARGHGHEVPATLPHGALTWAHELLMRERVLELACVHAQVVGGSGRCDASLNLTAHMSAFVTADGGLYTCGETTPVVLKTGAGRCPVALGHSVAQSAPVVVPKRVPSLSAVRVRAVGVGWYHMLALSDAGTVYSCGVEFAGQLGLGNQGTSLGFEPVGGALETERIVSIAASADQSFALTAGGAVYSWGSNLSGQLGHGDREERWEPERIEALDGVRVGGVSAGEAHTLALSTCGAVYSFGCGYDGRCGHGGMHDELLPRRVDGLDGLAAVRAVHVSAGGDHSLVVDASGGVHAFGWGCFGALGHGGHTEGYHPEPICIEALAGVRAVRASAGLSSCAVLGADGSVHAFGRNAEGQLGVGHALSVRRPRRVYAPDAFAGERVLGVSLAPYHAMYVTADGRVHTCGALTGALGRGTSTGAAYTHGEGDLHLEMRCVEELPRVHVLGHGGC